MYKYLILTLLISLSITGCKENAGTDDGSMSLSNLLSKAKSDPSTENMSAYFKQVNTAISNQDNQANHPEILQNAADLAIELKQANMATSYLVPLVKSHAGPKSESNLLNLVKMLNMAKKPMAAGVLYQGYKESYPNASADPTLDALINNEQSMSAYMDTTFNSVFKNPDEYGLNRKNALSFVDMAEAYALSKPEDAKAPFYLYRAAEIARSIRTIPKALTIYDWIMDKYPNYEKSATVLFLKGFILENDVKDAQAAKAIYETFISKYPDHELSSSVKFLIDNIGKSDAEILEFLEKSGDSK